MPRDSNGNASLDPVYKAVTGTTIQAVQHNTPLEDITSMLTGSVARNGAGGMSADLNMNGFTITNLAGDGLAPADGSVTTAKIAANAVTPAKLALGAWTDVASASTVDLGAQASRNLRITGTTTITSFGTAGADDNVPYFIRFAASLTLTNGASLILPGAANITTEANDVAVVVHDTTSVWRVVSYIRSANSPRVVGEAATNLVALDASAKLPAVDGSQLTGLPFTKSFESDELSIVLGGAFSVTHGLGVAPKLVQVWLRCKTAELNYAVDDMVLINPSYFYDGGHNGIAVVSRTTTLVGIVGNQNTNIPLLNLTSGVKATIKLSSWRIVLRAFA